MSREPPAICITEPPAWLRSALGLGAAGLAVLAARGVAAPAPDALRIALSCVGSAFLAFCAWVFEQQRFEADPVRRVVVLSRASRRARSSVTWPFADVAGVALLPSAEAGSRRADACVRVVLLHRDGRAVALPGEWPGRAAASQIARRVFVALGRDADAVRDATPAEAAAAGRMVDAVAAARRASGADLRAGRDSL